MEKNFRWHMLITSFMPLWIIIIVSNAYSVLFSLLCDKKNGVKELSVILKENVVSLAVILVLFIIMIWSAVYMNKFLNQLKEATNLPKIRILKASKANNLSSEYLLAYVLPMIAFDFSVLRGVLLFIIYFGILAYLCIRNNNVYINIWLEIKGYKMYYCDLGTKIAGKEFVYENSLVISKNPLSACVDKEIEYWDFDNYIYIDLGRI